MPFCFSLSRVQREREKASPDGEAVVLARLMRQGFPKSACAFWGSRVSPLQQPLTAYGGAPLAQGRHHAAVSAVKIRVYTRCRQRVLRLDPDATFAGFRRTFGALRGSPTRIIERWGFRRDKLRAGSKRRYIFGLLTAHKAVDLQGRALLLVSFLARARKVHP